LNYKPHPGVVLTNICNIPVLIPLRVAYPNLQTLTRLSVFMVPLWLDLSEGRGTEHYVATMSKLTHNDEDSVRKRVEQFCEEYCRLGYLIKVSDDAAADHAQQEAQSPDPSKNV